jgi:hypothetical protein
VGPTGAAGVTVVTAGAVVAAAVVASTVAAAVVASTVVVVTSATAVVAASVGASVVAASVVAASVVAAATVVARVVTALVVAGARAVEPSTVSVIEVELPDSSVGMTLRPRAVRPYPRPTPRQMPTTNRKIKTPHQREGLRDKTSTRENRRSLINLLLNVSHYDLNHASFSGSFSRLTVLRSCIVECLLRNALKTKHIC